MNILAKTSKELMYNAKKELKELGYKIKKKDESSFEIKDLTSKDIFNIASFSHFIERLYLDEEDIVGFSLFSRDFLHKAEDYVPFYLVDKIVDDLKITRDEKIIDPLANVGEIILEVGTFLTKHPLHTKKKLLFEEKPGIKAPLNRVPQEKVSLVGVVQENIEFKRFEENARFLRLKPKCSKFDLDWLDVKYHNGDFDYVITKLPSFEFQEESDEFCKEFFYQAEFIAKKKVIVFTTQELSKSTYKEYLKLVEKNYAFGYYYYIFK